MSLSNHGHYSPYRRPLLIVYAVVMAVVIYSIYYLFRYYPPVRANEAESTLQSLQKTLRVSADVTSTKYVDWIGKDGDSLPLRSVQFVLGTTNEGGSGKYGNIQPGNLLTVNDAFLKPLRDNIFIFYKEQGFSEDPINTVRTTDGHGVLRLGFSKDGLYCVTILTGQTDPFGQMSCGTIDKGQLFLQKRVNGLREELENDNSGKTTSDESSQSVFRVEKIEGSFALGSLSGFSGYTWIARKTDGKWKVVWKGQEAPSCADMRKFKVPESVYQMCSRQF